MPPQKTQISCPRCRQPIVAQIEQLFDVSADPGAKQRLLGGISNFAVCRSCGFNGPLATPIVYHDNDKELLLTYFPPELNLPVNEQEKLIGPLINQVTNRLTAEKRKAYLLRPQNFLTYQSLIERILGADGITPEMIQSQQKRVSLIERLLSATTPQSRSELIKKEADILDAEFFSIFSRLLESALASGQEQYAKEMQAIQQQLLTESDYGTKISQQANEIQEAIKSLKSVGKELNRDKLMELLIGAPNDDRLSALVSLTRPALDYQFFQSLSEKIETKTGDERKKLESLREKLLDITRRLDQRAEEEYKRAEDLLKSILAAEDIQTATFEHIEEISDMFVQVLNRSLQEAKKKNDQDLVGKLQQVVAVLQQASSPPAELALLEELIQVPDEKSLNQLLEEHSKEITPEFISIVAGVLARSEEQAGEKATQKDAEVITKIQTVYRTILKYSMQKNMS
jgi:hypothetical protein